jgi:RNA polymerase sigma factor (sigma-70 family)
MKYTYTNATGTTEIEIDEQFYDLLIEMDRDEFNSDRKHSRRYPISLESCEYEGEWFEDDIDLLADIIQRESYARLRAAIEKLEPSQQDLIHKIYVQNRKIIAVAKEDGVSEAAVRNRLKKIYARLKKFLL